ncbi:MAG TPA: T9SS type A sorting domain-containing protein [Ignavibacteria bacterium]|nr:T9SS type A sorting domain-containing protein [Ignavibacteria bacterium]
MKKFILLLCFLFISSAGFSQIFSENFDYSAGTVLSSTALWDVSSGGGTNALTVSAPGLTFPNYLGSGIGNDIPLTTSGEDDSASITPRQTSGTVYASFMINVGAAQTGDYFFALSTTGNAFDARVYARSSGAGFNLGITKANEAAITWGSAVYNFGTTYLVVDKYVFNASALDDQVSLFVFDTSAPITEPAPTIGPITSTATDAINLSRVILRQGTAGSAPTLIIDGIYIDNVWNNNVLPVELSSFTSAINKRDVTLRWSTASETNNSNFEIERSSVNGSYSKVGSVAGNGTVPSTSNYFFTDRNLSSGNYSYRLKQIDFNGNFEYFNLNNEVNVGIPSKFELSQNYPNPFNPSTTINFDIPSDGKVSIKLFDMSGKEVAVLVNEVKTAGYYSVNFNASSLSSGIYFYNITADNFTSTKKMTLIK